MGMYSERLSTTIHGRLTFWRLRENGAVEGTVDWVDQKLSGYNIGSVYVFCNTKLQHWPAAEGFWPDHFIMKTQSGLYFILKDKDKYSG